MVHGGAELDSRSIALRQLMLGAFAAAGGGHVGPSFSCVELLRALYDRVARHRPAEPDWPDRDRVVLSKGHACVALYALLADHGYFDPAVLRSVGAAGSILGGHPERHLVPGVEYSTGSLGHGLPAGVGMALALRARGSPARVFVVLGDGELGEGSAWEAVMSASHHRLANVCLLVDRNGVQSSGTTADVLDLEPLVDKLDAFGCATRTVDGHDVDALEAQLAGVPFERDRPSALVCGTVKGRGLEMAEGDAAWHYRGGLSDGDLAEMRDALGRAGAQR